VDFGGYLSEMPSVVFVSNPQEVYWQNLVHSRLNFGWQMSGYFRFEASARTRFLTGSEMMINTDEIGADKGVVDLSWNVFPNKRVFPNEKFATLNVALDRLNASFEKGKISLKIGRQRINWGQNFVWNPNDVFNTYSFFDFDYAERPGCDAFHGTYYHSATSQTEIAASVNTLLTVSAQKYERKITAAARRRLNWKNFDFQMIGGMFQQSDLVLGGAWTGDMKGVSFRGEFSVFQPFQHFADTTATVAASVGFDYTFANSLFLQAEMLYNNVHDTNYDGILGLYAAPLSAKTLSISDWNIFAQANYPFSPRLNGSLSGMYFVDIKAIYTGFSLDFSVLENLDLSLISQYFYAAEPLKMHAVFGFARLKYSF
jgi:hypothetical protein